MPLGAQHPGRGQVLHRAGIWLWRSQVSEVAGVGVGDVPGDGSMRAQELGPRDLGSAQGGVDPSVFEDLPHGGCSDGVSRIDQALAALDTD